MVQGNDGFIVRFNSTGNRLWASYFGGNKNDRIYSAFIDITGNIFIAGATGSTSGLSTSGSFQTSLGGTYNGFIAKIGDAYPNEAGIDSIALPIKICEGTTALLIRLTNFGTDTLKKVQLNWSLNGKTQTAVSWTGTLLPDSSAKILISNYSFVPGIDTIKVWSSQPNGFTDPRTLNDTAKLITTVAALPKAITGSSQSICNSQSASIGAVAVSGNTYTWTSLPSGFISSLSNPTVSPGKTTWYYLTEKVISSGCSKMDSVKVTVNPLPTPAILGYSSACGFSIEFYSTKKNSGSTYLWKLSGGNIISGQGNDSIRVKLDSAGSAILKVIETSSAGCKDSAVRNINILSLPKPVISGKSQVCMGDSLLYSTPSNSGSSYKWSQILNGKIYAGSSANGINVKWSKAGKDLLKVIETNANGCKDSAVSPVSIHDLPDARWTSTYKTMNIVRLKAMDSLQSKYAWAFSDTTTDTGYSILHNIQLNRKYTVTLKVENAAGCFSSKTDTFSIRFTNLQNQQTSPPFTLNICPNPFMESTTLKFKTEQAGYIRVSLLNAQGQESELLPYQYTQGGQEQMLQIGKAAILPSGLYFVKVAFDGKVLVLPVSKL